MLYITLSLQHSNIIEANAICCINNNNNNNDIFICLTNANIIYVLLCKMIHRKCSNCQHTGNLKCSKCQVTIYCSPSCQKKHWKRSHKVVCKPNIPTPPLITAYKQSDEEINFKWIVLAPCVSNEDTLLNCSGYLSGINEDSDMDLLVKLTPLGIELDTENNLKARYGWLDTPNSKIIPGKNTD